MTHQRGGDCLGRIASIIGSCDYNTTYEEVGSGKLIPFVFQSFHVAESPTCPVVETRFLRLAHLLADSQL